MPKRPDSGLKLPFLPVLVDFYLRGRGQGYGGGAEKNQKKWDTPMPPMPPMFPSPVRSYIAKGGRGSPINVKSQPLMNFTD